ILLDEFRRHYHHFQSALTQVCQDTTGDVHHLVLLGEDLEEFANIVSQNSAVFPDHSEWQVLQVNVQSMILDLRTTYDRRVERSHHSRPNVIFQERSGFPGRPRTIIDPNFLRWAHGRRTTSGIAQFLGVSRRTVRRSLLEYQIEHPGRTPFTDRTNDNSLVEDTDSILEPHQAIPQDLPPEVQNVARLIRWGIVIHGFIDGYSRLITALRAHNNNRSSTVLSLFLS
ncbi:hypothetical protein F5878DRAFT_498744, partial [Lentinula raphanica]